MSGPGKHAVDRETRTINYLSPSQIKTFDPDENGGCPRRWYANKVEGFVEASTPQQNLGTVVASQLEHYLKTGEDGLGPIARAGKSLLPVPGPGLVVEEDIPPGGLAAAGIPVIGRPDFLNLRGLTARQDPGYPFEADRDGRPTLDPIGTVEIVDHKTSSNFEYAKTGESLAHETQMVSYAVYVAKRWKPEHVRLSHIYYHTKKRDSIKRSVLVCLPVVCEDWRVRVEPIVEQMKVAVKAPCFDDVPRNDASCYAFNRPCPHLSRCNPDPIKVLTMSLMDTLRKKPATSPPPSPAPTATVATAPAASNPPAPNVTISPKTGKPIPPPAGMAADGPFYTDQQQMILGVDRDGIPQKPLLVIDRTKEKPAAPAPAPIPVAVGVLPPDAPKSDPALAAKMDPPPAAPPPAPAAEAAPTEGKRRRGRPAGSKSAAATAVRIFVDCIPSEDFDYLDTYVDALHSKVCEAASVPDVALVEYGKGKGMLRAAAKASPPEPGCYAVMSGDLNAPVLEALSGFVVARGAR